MRLELMESHKKRGVHAECRTICGDFLLLLPRLSQDRSERRYSEAELTAVVLAQEDLGATSVCKTDQHA